MVVVGTWNAAHSTSNTCKFHYLLQAFVWTPRINHPYGYVDMLHNRPMQMLKHNIIC